MYIQYKPFSDYVIADEQVNSNHLYSHTQSSSGQELFKILINLNPISSRDPYLNITYVIEIMQLHCILILIV